MLFLLSFFTLVFVSNSYGIEPLNREALMATAEYHALVNAPQDEKDRALRNASGHYSTSLRAYSRESNAIALLAGANPNIPEHAPFENQKFFENGGFLQAIRNNDFKLLELFLERKLDTQLITRWWKTIDSPWVKCKTLAMAEFLVKNGIPILDEKNNAVDYALTHHTHISYIAGLLQLEPRAALGTERNSPLLHACFKDGHEIRGGSKQSLLKILLDRGANPYECLSVGQGESPLQVLATGGILPRDIEVNRQLAPWLEKYYRDRQRFLCTALTHVLLQNNKRLPRELIERIMGYLMVDPCSVTKLTFKEWQSYGSNYIFQK